MRRKTHRSGGKRTIRPAARSRHGVAPRLHCLARMKLATAGRHLWSRAIGSTAVGAGVDSLIFYPVAFLDVWATRDVLVVMATNYVLKVLWEVIALPMTYRVVAALKRAEHEDWFDRDTDFTPFSLQAG